MAFFTWSEEYRVGVAVVDMQHQKLFQLAENLFEAMSKGKGQEALSRTLQELVSYTVMHFSTEERLMAGKGYPAEAAHKEAHRQLTDQVKQLQARFREGNAHITVELMNFLKTWLDRHIKGTDRQLAAYLAAQRV